MVQERVDTTSQDPQLSGSFPPSSSGGILVEREQAKRLSWPLLILLFLLLGVFFWLYLFGPGGRFGESLSSRTDYSFAPVELVSPKPSTRPRTDADAEVVEIVPPGGFETGDGHALGAPGTKGGKIILAPDPTTPAPPATTLTQAERDFEPNLMMGMNRVQAAIDYVTRMSLDRTPEVVSATAAKYRDVVDFNRNLQPTGRWVPIYQGYLPTIDLLENSLDRIAAGETANAAAMMAGVQASLDAARVPMDRLVDGSSTY